MYYIYKQKNSEEEAYAVKTKKEVKALLEGYKISPSNSTKAYTMYYKGFADTLEIVIVEKLDKNDPLIQEVLDKK